MTLDEYQTASMRTLNISLSAHDALANYALGLAGERGLWKHTGADLVLIARAIEWLNNGGFRFGAAAWTRPDSKGAPVPVPGSTDAVAVQDLSAPSDPRSDGPI